MRPNQSYRRARVRQPFSPIRPYPKCADAAQARDCRLNNAFMQQPQMALVVILEPRIADFGLVDVRAFNTTELFVTP